MIHVEWETDTYPTAHSAAVLSGFTLFGQTLNKIITATRAFVTEKVQT